MLYESTLTQTLIPTPPHNDELAYLANQINGLTNSPQDFPLSDDHYLELMDYHGISFLVNGKSPMGTDVNNLTQQRKALMGANEMLKHQALEHLCTSLNHEKLDRIIFFKGTALAYTVYEQPWIRPRTDVDCIIHKDELAFFSDILVSLGYKKQFSIEGKSLSYQSSFTKQLTKNCWHNIDVHWRINNRQILSRAFNVDELLKDAQRLPDFQSKIYSPSDVDNILIAALHRLGHHHYEERLIWLYDVHLLAQRLNQEQWQDLCHKAHSKKISAITLDALTLANRLFNTPIDSNARELLSKHSLRKEPSQLFLDRNKAEWQYVLGDLVGFDSITEKIQFIFENLFPSPAFVRRQMDTKYTLIAYLKRIIRGLKRLAAKPN